MRNIKNKYKKGDIIKYQGLERKVLAVEYEPFYSLEPTAEEKESKIQKITVWYEHIDK